MNIGQKSQVDALYKMANAFKADGKITPQEASKFAQSCISTIMGRPATPGEIQWLTKVFTSPSPYGWDKDISNYIKDLIAWKAKGGK